MSAESKFTGVYWCVDQKKWNAKIVMPNRCRLNLGYFDYERDAAIAYDKAAAKIGKPTNILKKKTF